MSGVTRLCRTGGNHFQGMASDAFSFVSFLLDHAELVICAYTRHCYLSASLDLKSNIVNVTTQVFIHPRFHFKEIKSKTDSKSNYSTTEPHIAS